MSEPVVYLGGRFIPASEAKLDLHDIGVLSGVAITDMTRTFRHQPFRLDEHLARFYRSAKYTSIDLPLTQKEMEDRTLELIATNSGLIDEDDDLGVVHFATPGVSSAGSTVAQGLHQAEGPMTPTLGIQSWPLRFDKHRHMFVDGGHVVTPAIRHVPPQSLDPKTKHRNRLHFHVADQQSHAVDPKATSLLLDLDGNITECTGANIVVVKGRTIYSPTSRTILQGVSLQTVRDLAPQLGLEFEEKDLQPYDVINADEAWLTSTPFSIAPVTRINNLPIGDGVIGPLFREMVQAWSELVGVNILGQILEQ